MTKKANQTEVWYNAVIVFERTDTQEISGKEEYKSREVYYDVDEEGDTERQEHFETAKEVANLWCDLYSDDRERALEARNVIWDESKDFFSETGIDMCNKMFPLQQDIEHEIERRRSTGINSGLYKVYAHVTPLEFRRTYNPWLDAEDSEKLLQECREDRKH